ncbi:chaperonin [Culex quinquefasciatus]|uniref:Chaperonin n=1 Tax=Culex quinquefasciatus TaxID=7176 RepID=B0XG00_CULQU|nr:chaperonin [Culex quinquefasciatus]|eukprot:XP_001868572.1 chaperonin [Culex quinquefasciatus]
MEKRTTIADLICTCLGPHAMLKMLMNQMVEIVMIIDDNAILLEIDTHLAAKSIIARIQDEKVTIEPVPEQHSLAHGKALENIIKLLPEDASVPVDKAKLEVVVQFRMVMALLHFWTSAEMTMETEKSDSPKRRRHWSVYDEFEE